jgi:hypothetical protein
MDVTSLHYHERLVETIPLSRCRLFVLLNDFVLDRSSTE